MAALTVNKRSLPDDVESGEEDHVYLAGISVQPDSQSPSAGGDSEPFLPTRASSWTQENAEDIGIFYESKSWQGIVSKCEKAWTNFDEKVVEIRSRIYDVFVDLMNAVPLDLSSSDATLAAELLTAEQDSDIPDLVCVRLLERISSAVAHACASLKTNELVTQMSFDTRLGAEIIKYAFNRNVATFLEAFRKMIVRHQQSRYSTGEAFMGLFQTFARIFMMEFRSSQDEFHEMCLFNQKVRSEPDLRYEVRRLMPGSISSVAVVSVAEVKKDAGNLCKDAGIHKTKGTATVNPPLKKRKVDDDVVGLGMDLRGRHAVELLAETPYSIFEGRTIDNRTLVLGFIVEATKVRLTCLDMSKDHLNQLRDKKFRPLQQNSHAKVYISEAHDMLTKEGWKELSKMLITVGSIGDRCTRPFDQLMCFLPPGSVRNMR